MRTAAAAKRLIGPTPPARRLPRVQRKPAAAPAPALGALYTRLVDQLQRPPAPQEHKAQATKLLPRDVVRRAPSAAALREAVDAATAGQPQRRPALLGAALSWAPASVAREALPSTAGARALNGALAAVARDEGAEAAVALAAERAADLNAWSFRVLFKALLAAAEPPSPELVKRVWTLAEPLQRSLSDETYGLYVGAALRGQHARQSLQGYSRQTGLVLEHLRETTGGPPPAHAVQAVLSMARSAVDIRQAARLAPAALARDAFAAAARVGAPEALPAAMLLLREPSGFSARAASAGVLASLQLGDEANALRVWEQASERRVRLASGALRALLPALAARGQLPQARGHAVLGECGQALLLRFVEVSGDGDGDRDVYRWARRRLLELRPQATGVVAGMLRAEARSGAPWGKLEWLWRALAVDAPAEPHYAAMLAGVDCLARVDIVRGVLRLMVADGVVPGDVTERALQRAVAVAGGEADGVHVDVALMGLQQIQAHFETLQGDRAALEQHTQAVFELLEFAVQESSWSV